MENGQQQRVSWMANDRIYNELWGFGVPDGAFICECKDSCTVEIVMAPSEYLRLRDRDEVVYALGHNSVIP